MTTALVQLPVTLRPYQADAVNAVQQALQTSNSTMINMATGAGKTQTFTEVARRACARGQRVLVLALRRELIEQASEKMRAAGMTTVNRLEEFADAQVTVTTVQSAAHQLDKVPSNTFGLVIYDELHHLPSAGSKSVVGHFTNGGAKLLGATATVDRADGVSLKTVIDTCAFRYSLVDAIQAGYLVPPRGIRVEVPGLDLSKVRRRTRKTTALGSDGFAGEFTDLHPAALAQEMLTATAVEGVAGPTFELAGDRPTIVFAVNRAHAKAITAALNARRADCARYVDGAMKKAERKATLAEFAAGAYQYLVNVQLCVEGVDIPRIACVAMARPTTSRIFFSQACGRALRLFEGKSDALILDFVGVCEQKDLIGPDDVFAGVMVGPAERPRSNSVSAPVSAEYVSDGRGRRFAKRVVELLRKVGRRAGRAGGWLVRAFKKLVG